MKFSTYLLLTGAVSANADMTQIVNGFLKTSVDADFKISPKCIADAKEAETDVKAVVADFKAKDIQHIVDALKETLDLVKTVKNALTDCKPGAQAEWKKLDDMSMVLERPASLSWTVGKNLLINGNDIYSEVDSSVKAYENQKWEEFGEKLGQAVSKTLLGSEDYTTYSKKEKLAEVFQGLTDSFGGHFNLLALLECIGDEDKALLMLDAAVQSFETAWKKKEWGDAIGGVIATIAAFKQFRQGLPICEAVDSSKWNEQLFDQCMDVAESPLKYFTIVEDDLKINGVSIVEDGVTATEAYKSGDYKTFGYKMGEILKLATKKEQTELEQSKNPLMAAEVLQGFLTSTGVGHIDFTNLLMCVYDADQAAIDLYGAVSILESAFKDKKIGEGIAGVLFAVQAFKQFRAALPVCASIEQDDAHWDVFDQILATLESPEKHMHAIKEDIVMNGVTITGDINEAFESLDSEEYRDFGFLLGQTLTLATLGHESNLSLY